VITSRTGSTGAGLVQGVGRGNAVMVNAANVLLDRSSGSGSSPKYGWLGTVPSATPSRSAVDDVADPARPGHAHSAEPEPQWSCYRPSVRSDRVFVRDATGEDVSVLSDALFQAVNWHGEVRVDLPGIIASAELRHYVAGWPRPGDFGVVAVDDTSPVGAAWCRTFTSQDPGFGFVAEDVPEVSMGVATGRRGDGVGTALLRELLLRARARGLRAVSLSVEDGNRARVLYERAGFAGVGRNANSEIMLLHL
jgi:ribosomal protein S18 acetylase RimI-like enzyme